MKVTKTIHKILELEFRQEKGDEHYGSCLWARFYFNLDKYELSIVSDCGNYAYKWVETPGSESFLALIARMDGDYLLNKLVGPPHIFSLEATRDSILKDNDHESDETKAAIKKFFDDFPYEPECIDSFVRMTEEERDYLDESDYTDEMFDGISIIKDFDSEYLYQIAEKVYSANELKIIEIFENSIQPWVRGYLKEQKGN